MTRLASRLRRDAEFEENARHHRALAGELRARLARIREGWQAEISPPGGRIFFTERVMPGGATPGVAVGPGPSTAGGAYVPAVCDENIIVGGRGAIYLGGPPLVRAATGEQVTAEELGGGEVH